MSDEDNIDDVDVDGLNVDDDGGDDNNDEEGGDDNAGAASKGGAKKKGKVVKGKKKGKAPAKVKINTKVKVADGLAKIVTATGVSTYRTVTGVLTSRPTSKDVKIEGFNLQSHGLVLIHDTNLEFTIGRRYGLIGENGCGKSTLLKSLANREVPIPDIIDIYLLDTEAEPSDKNAVDWVVEEVKTTVKLLEKQAEKIMELYGDCDALTVVYDRLDELDPSTFDHKAGSLLHGLGFSPAMMKKPTKEMSGGWRMRVALAKALFIQPTLLLLDEPTNHLDLEACVWLENYLATYKTCLVVISHSQDFLNGVCTNIIHITPKGTLVNYGGNYDQFVITKKENEVNQMRKYEKEQDDIKHLKQFISSCGTYSNLVRQAKSKQKILDKMEVAGLTPKVETHRSLNFRFENCEQLPPPVLQASNIGFAYSGDMKDSLYVDTSFALDLDSRVALVGPNGVGKSTLIKIILGELAPTTGEIKRHSHLKFAKYHQHSHEILKPDLNPLDFMIEFYEGKIKKEVEDWRGHLGRYGVSGKMQKKLIGTLSDGQQTRIIFAMLALEKPHILLLDEPTNHLDMECIDSLAEAINHFNGGLLLVSHDFRLIDQVAKDIWVVDKKTVTPWKEGIRGYKKNLIANMKKDEFRPEKAL